MEFAEAVLLQMSIMASDKYTILSNLHTPTVAFRVGMFQTVASLSYEEPVTEGVYGIVCNGKHTHMEAFLYNGVSYDSHSCSTRFG